MKKGDIITCSDEKDLKKAMRDISLAGFRAFRVSEDGESGEFRIEITDVPDEEYLVQSSGGNGPQRVILCRSLEEAEEAADIESRRFEFVEILKGHRGEWESISRSW